MPSIIYPPQEIIEPPKLERKNIELILLWMLSNNEECLWSDFTNDPLKFSTSTISKYLNKFKDKGYLVKKSRGCYVITPKGRGRLNELSLIYDEDKKLNYPPNIIRRRRSYRDWILWMLYNNTFCRWSDFLEPPLSINQSSLSKSINRLLDRHLIHKENKEYRITQSGKIEYSKMLRDYNLDRQSLLDEESKRIEEITKKTLEFFKKFNINSESIQFRFLNNILKLDYERVKPLLKKPSDFEKIILFLSLNHPDEYPDFISIKNFSIKYQINENKLAYYLDEIVENQIYPIKFFKIEVNPNKIYYFQENGKLESILRAITENHISKNTYLTRLHSKSIDLIKIENAILDEICKVVFNKSMKNALRSFLPNYINYLAYKIEDKLVFKYSYDKLDAVVWHNMLDLYSNKNPDDLRYQFIGQNEINYQLNNQFLQLLKPYYKDDLNSLNIKVLNLIDQEEFSKALKIINSKQELFTDHIVLIVVKAVLLCYLNRHNEVLEFIRQIGEFIEGEKERSYKILLLFLVSFSNMTFGNFQISFETSNKSLNLYPNHPLSYAAKGIILAYNHLFKIDKENAQNNYGIEELDQAINLDSNNLNKGYYNLLKSKVFMELNNITDAIDSIDSAINFAPKKLAFYLSKGEIYLYFNKYDELLTLLERMLDLFPKQEIDLKVKKASVYKQIGKINEGFQIIKNLFEAYPEEPFILNSLAYWYLYLNRKEDAIKTIEKLINIQPETSLFYDTYGEILMYYQDYSKAAEQFKFAIEKSTYGWLIYQTYVKLAICYKELKEIDLAKKYFNLGIEYTEKCFSDFKTKNKWLAIAKLFLAEIEELD